MLTLGVEFNSLDGGEQHWFIKAVHRNLFFMNMVLHPCVELMVRSRLLPGSVQFSE